VADDVDITFGSSGHRIRDLKAPRPLSGWERGVAALMTAPLGQETDRVAEQIEQASVDAQCLDCPTCWFSIPKEVMSVLDDSGDPWTGVAPLHAIAHDLDGMDLEVLLHIVDGYAKELEVIRWDGEPIQRLPDLGEWEITLTGTYWTEAPPS
jgi:hypothetical protein